MDGQAQVPIHLYRASDSAHIQLCEWTRILSLTLHMLLATQDPTVCFNPYRVWPYICEILLFCTSKHS